MTRRIQTPHQIFNTLDELGLLSGLDRDPGESNLDYKQRLADFWKNNPASTNQGLVGALSVEFGLEPYNVINKNFFWLEHQPITASGVTVLIDGVDKTPQLVNYTVKPSGWPDIRQSEFYGTAESGWILWQDDIGEYTRLLEFVDTPSGSFVSVEYSYDEGGKVFSPIEGDQDLERTDPIYGLDGYWKIYREETPDASQQIVINELGDRDYLFDEGNGLVDNVGIPTMLLKRIVSLIQEASPISWGRFTWDEAFFQDNPESIETLPSIFDASISGYVSEGQNTDFQSGIGGDANLLVVKVQPGPGKTTVFHPSGNIF